MATFLVTGANRGIGLEYCRQLKARGDDVVAVCRQTSDELECLGVRVEAGLELSDSQAIDDLVQRLDGLPLDGVILNAGILQSMGLMDLDPSGIRRQFEVNALAPLLLARALVDQMPNGAKLVLMTSRMGSIDDNRGGGSYIYRSSKTALNSVVRSLSVDLREEGFSVALLHPGWVRTDMGGPNGLIDVATSVSGMMSVIEGLSLTGSGQFFNYDGSIIPW